MEDERLALTGSVGLVPTMGYLHDGHLSLVQRSVSENDATVVSIFVNPTQFGPNEDFERYPRGEERDLALLGDANVDIVFIPGIEEMYPPGFDEWVEVEGPVTERLEGKHRPEHFRGVTTVVSLLFRIVQPHRAYFGEKDAQQLRVVRRLVKNTGLPVDVVGVPTVRDPDGLAMSSRNVFLTSEDRRAALALSRALERAQAMVRAGETDAKKVRDAAMMTLTAEPRLILDYVSVADDETLTEVEKIERPALLLLAGRVGETRLIDNVLLVPPDAALPSEVRYAVNKPE
jgi:pantoate--beta-alanine ligase